LIPNIIINMQKKLLIIIIIFLSFSLYSFDSGDFLGIWKVKTLETVQIIQLYTDGFDYFTNGYRIREEYLDDPYTYIEFDFVDEDLLYITRSDGSRLRGFYQLMENSGINKDDFPYYIYMEDKYTNAYYFPVRLSREEVYEINYDLQLNLRDELIQISCLAELSREKTP